MRYFLSINLYAKANGEAAVPTAILTASLDVHLVALATALVIFPT